jgi:hypothetical protein
LAALRPIILFSEMLKFSKKKKKKDSNNRKYMKENIEPSRKKS